MKIHTHKHTQEMWNGESWEENIKKDIECIKENLCWFIAQAQIFIVAYRQ